MPIELKKTVAVCSDICTIEEAETLLEWLLDNPKGKINLKSCEQLHTAIVQVLIASNAIISVQPDNSDLKQLMIACSLNESGKV